MYMDPWLLRLLQDVYGAMAAQKNQLTAMAIQLEQLQVRVNALSDRKQTVIEKIEYTFDQLKVETLEGTLNIGITPGGVSSIEEWAVNQAQQGGGVAVQAQGQDSYDVPDQQEPGPAEFSGQPPGGAVSGSEAVYPSATSGGTPSGMPMPAPFLPRLQQKVMRYVDHDVLSLIRSLEVKYEVPLTDEFRQEMVKDIRIQADQRILLYMKLLGAGAADEPEKEADIWEKVKRDIRLAIEQFFARRKKPEGPSA